jgi:hypothetical protein
MRISESSGLTDQPVTRTLKSSDTPMTPSVQVTYSVFELSVARPSCPNDLSSASCSGGSETRWELRGRQAQYRVEMCPVESGRHRERRGRSSSPREIEAVFEQGRRLVRDGGRLPYISKRCGSNAITAQALSLLLLLAVALVGLFVQPHENHGVRTH